MIKNANENENWNKYLLYKYILYYIFIFEFCLLDFIFEFYFLDFIFEFYLLDDSA